MATHTPVVLFGATGLVGSHILTTLLSTDAYNPITTIGRRDPKPAAVTPPPAQLNSVINTDVTTWPTTLSGLTPLPSAVFASVATTRANGGGLANQWKIDHDLNIDLAKAAKAAGVKTYVHISSAGLESPLAGSVPYSKMKIGVEKAIKALEFDQAIVLRPATIMGDREEKDNRTVERLWIGAIRLMGKVSPGVQDTLGQDVGVIARAAVRAVELAAQGKAPSKYWVVEGHEILKLGRAEAATTAPVPAQ